MKRRGLAEVVLAALGEPGKLGLFLAALFAVLALRAATLAVDDPDVWWIAAAGRDMLATLRAPATNAYSYTAPDMPWVMHELAFGVLYAIGLGTVGPPFFPLLTLFAAAGAVGVAATAIVRRTRHAPSAGLALLILLVGCRDALFAPRPSHTALVLPLAMTALAFAPGWSTLRTLAVVALEALWANAHGSFPLGVAIVAAGAFADDAAGRKRRLVAATLAAVATLANPYGIRLHRLVGGYALGGDPASSIVHEHIVEFFPIWRGGPPFVNPFNAAALAILVALVASALVARRHLARAVLASLLLALAAYQVRHVTLAVALGAVLLHAEIDDLCRSRGLVRRDLPRWLAVAIVVPGLILGIAAWSRARLSRTDTDWIAPATGGAPLVRLLGELPEKTRAYVPFESGGLAMWLGAERGVRVFFDSRNDCYPPEIAEAAFALEREESAEWVDQALTRTGTDVALVREAHPVYRALRRSSAWRVSRSDEDWVEFRR